MKRRIAFLTAAIVLLAFCCGCTKHSEEITTPPEESPAETEAPEQAGSGAAANEKGFDLLGLVIEDDGSDRAYMTMYGFLHTAETLSYAAKI